MIRWLVRKMRHDHESLLSLLIAARTLEQQRLDVSLIFRAGYRAGQLNPLHPLNPKEPPSE